ncbi:MAG: 16S rRNA (cytosine(1402)-N(4))-methyltransferase RsmH [Pyrinomonadaceae bacterium]
MNTSAKNFQEIHRTVLLDEAIEYLNVRNEGTYLDATLGLGGHAERILSIGIDVKLQGIDQDREALKIAEKRLAKFANRVGTAHANFSELGKIVNERGISGLDGILADLGASSLQMDSETRGFSFRFDAALDMRMNPDSDSETAADLLKRLSEKEIADLIYLNGEERFSRRIAKRIVEARRSGKHIETTKQLAKLVEQAIPGKRDRIHPATKTFQALRIAVNNELAIIKDFLKTGVKLLNPGGRIVVITFHSLEDRIVKHTFQKLSGKCECPPRLPRCVCGAKKQLDILTKKPIAPNDAELDLNPRARSAKLRAAEKI